MRSLSVKLLQLKVLNLLLWFYVMIQLTAPVKKILRPYVLLDFISAQHWNSMLSMTTGILRSMRNKSLWVKYFAELKGGRVTSVLSQHIVTSYIYPLTLKRTILTAPADQHVQVPMVAMKNGSQLCAAPTLPVEMELFKLLLRNVMMQTPLMMMIVSIHVHLEFCKNKTFTIHSKTFLFPLHFFQIVPQYLLPLSPRGYWFRLEI